jgi:TatD DNase family protein
MLVDTHCHIHETGYPLDIGNVMTQARQAGVSKLMCVGTSEQSSIEAIAFATQHEHCYATVGVHPHDAKDGYNRIVDLVRISAQSPSQNGFAPGSIRAPASDRSLAADVLTNETDRLPQTIVAIGEIGLDYFYTHSPRELQIKALETQLQLALDHNLPVIFHVRDAFDDFWPIFDNFSGLKGELHSFTDDRRNLEKGLERGLFIGVNGISTFTKDEAQQATFDLIPLDKLLLETDAPFLTPVPYRGKVNQPAYVRVIAEYHAQRRHISLKEIAATTTANATALFAL